MKVVLIQDGKELDLKGCKSVQGVLTKLAINPETVLVLRDGGLITRDEPVADTDRLEILPVISGGQDRRRGPQ